MKTWRSSVCILLALAGLAACQSPQGPPQEITAAEQKWQQQGIGHYRIRVLKVQSIWHAQTQSVTVQNEQVVEQSATCTPAPYEGRTCTVQPFDAAEFTVPGLFKTAQELAAQASRRTVKLTFDEQYGFPRTLSVDTPEVTDDDTMWRVVEFQVLP